MAQLPEQTFNVTVTFTANDDDFNSIGIEDSVPAGWVTQSNAAWCTPNANFVKVVGDQVQYAWFGPYSSGQTFTALYKVTVPAGASSGNYTFSGQFGYKIGGSSTIYDAIAGDEEVEVLSPTPTPTPTPEIPSGGEGGGSGGAIAMPTPTTMPEATPTPARTPTRTFVLTATPNPVPTPTHRPTDTPAPAQFSVSNLTVAPETFTAGDSVAITVDVLNTSSAPGSYLVELKINGTVEDSEEVNLAEGDSKTVSFNVTKNAVGVYTVEIGEQASTFIVSKPLTGVRWSLIAGVITAVLIAGLSVSFIYMRRRGLA